MADERQASVLHLDSSTGWGGGQNQVRLLMRELARAGIQQLCMCPAGSPLAHRLAEAGLPVRPTSWRGGSDPRAMWSVFAALRDYRIVHCHDAHALQVALLPGKLRGRKIIGARRVPFTTSAFKWNRADRVIAVSHTVRDVLVRSGVTPARIRVIHSGTDRAETRAVLPFEPRLRDQLGIPAHAFVVANAAYFVAWKGQLVIPPAAALLADVHWLLAGHGPMKPDLEAAVAQNGVQDRVHLLGWIPDARRLLKEVDAYVSASTEDGLGNSVTEALALGVPVLSANAGGGAEIMTPVHERTEAALFTAGDPQALANAVMRLREPGVRERVIAAQDERFRDFVIERTAAATLDVYREVLAS